MRGLRDILAEVTRFALLQRAAVVVGGGMRLDSSIFEEWRGGLLQDIVGSSSARKSIRSLRGIMELEELWVCNDCMRACGMRIRRKKDTRLTGKAG